MKNVEYLLVDEAETVALGGDIARILLAKNDDAKEASPAFVAYLNGDLGAGKTTLTRGFVRAMGHQGNVKSPTYTLVEPYELPPWRVFHFDLYRLGDPEELEYMGIRDYFNENCCCFVEWPEKGAGLLANADLIINMAYQGEQRIIKLQAESDAGNDVLSSLIKIRAK